VKSVICSVKNCRSKAKANLVDADSVMKFGTSPYCANYPLCNRHFEKTARKVRCGDSLSIADFKDVAVFMGLGVKPKAGYVYFIMDTHSGMIKIGSTRNLRQRFSMIKTSMPSPPMLLDFILCEKYSELETYMQKLLYEKRGNGEWFSVNMDSIRQVARPSVEKFGIIGTGFDDMWENNQPTD